MNTNNKYKNCSRKELEKKRVESRGQEKVILNMLLTDERVLQKTIYTTNDK